MSTISIDGQSIPVTGSVELDLFVRSERVNIQTHQWVEPPMVSARYNLSVVVDEHSGEDGALAPVASVTALFEDDFRLEIPLDREISLQHDQGHWEAFLGTDSWELEHNQWVIREFDGRSAKVTWSAVYGPEKDRKAFLFEGVATFRGIHVRANSANDLDRAIGDLWGAEVLAQLAKSDVRVYAEETPPLWSAWYRFESARPGA